MRLADFNPEFVRETGSGSFTRKGFAASEAQGVLLDCPCKQGHKLLVWFKHALGGGAPARPEATPTNRWDVGGSGLDDLTLTPSVNAGCWHGWLTKGEVR